MSGQKFLLEKQPGVRLVGAGEKWQHIFSKIVLTITGLESTMAYQDYQLCAGLKAGINGTIHRVQSPWEKNFIYGGMGGFTHRRKERVQQY